MAGWPANQRALGVPQNPNRVPLGGPVAHVEESLPLGGPGHHPPHPRALVAVIAVVDEGEPPGHHTSDQSPTRALSAYSFCVPLSDPVFL